jgi:photosynthetic reaction center cytochrome c subunit
MRTLVHLPGNLRNFLLVLIVCWAMPAAAQEPAAAPKTAGEVYKNIQVLKDLPAPQLMEVMHSFSHSLGVKCSFCHVEGAFDKDDKPQKQTARKMLTMAMGINKDNFGGERRVTCWTCHRGVSEPESKPEPAPAAK